MRILKKQNKTSSFKSLLAFSLLAGVHYSYANTAHAQIFKTKDETVVAKKIANFIHPWGAAMLPSGQILVSEREGALWLVEPNSGAKTQINGLPKLTPVGQGGLLDVAIAHDFVNSRKIFFTYSKRISAGVGTALASATLPLNLTSSEITLKAVDTIFEMNNPSAAGQHFGSRIAVNKDGTLFFTIGDRGSENTAQDPFNHAGSVLRINQDGSIPKDNPFAKGTKGAREIYSTGHRNPQGATLHPQTGELFTVEHGARGGDEINTPQAGKNYGWPVISYGKHYSGRKIGVGTQKQGLEQPQFYWDPSIAPSNLAFATGNKFKNWQGNLFVGALKDQKLVRLKMTNGKLEAVESLFEDEFGRIRDVRFFNEGYMWLLSDQEDGALIKISPAQK